MACLKPLDEKPKVYIFMDWANMHRTGNGTFKITDFDRYPNCITRLLADNNLSIRTAPRKTLFQAIMLAVAKMWVKLFIAVFDITPIAKLDSYKQLKIGLLHFNKDRASKTKRHITHTYHYAPQFDWLKTICARCNLYADCPPKEQCFAFVSHRPNKREELEQRPLFQRMAKHFQILWYERLCEVATVTEEESASATPPQTNTDPKEPKYSREQEKGVDVALGMEVVRVVLDEKHANSNVKLRVVILSCDSDFRPTVEFLLKNNVGVEVWAWEAGSCLSPTYANYLRTETAQLKVKMLGGSKKKQPDRRQDWEILYFLDRYRYQIGFVNKIDHIWLIKFTKHPSNELGLLDEAAKQEFISQFNALSHYTVVHRLTSRLKHKYSDNDFRSGFDTSDFTIHWGRNGFTFGFATEDIRNKFQNWLQSNDPIAKNLRGINHFNETWSQSKVKGKEEVPDVDVGSENRN